MVPDSDAMVLWRRPAVFLRRGKRNAICLGRGVGRNRCVTWLAVAAAAGASLATSAPQPDWTQSDSTPQRALSLQPGEDAEISVYAEGPPSFGVGLDFESDDRPPIEVTVTADGSSEPCTALTLGLDDWSAERIGVPARFNALGAVPQSCFSGDGGGLTIAFNVLARVAEDDEEPVTPVALYVTVTASASGDDDEPQEPRARVEFR